MTRNSIHFQNFEITHRNILAGLQEAEVINSSTSYIKAVTRVYDAIQSNGLMMALMYDLNKQNATFEKEQVAIRDAVNTEIVTRQEKSAEKYMVEIN